MPISKYTLDDEFFMQLRKGEHLKKWFISISDYSYNIAPLLANQTKFLIDNSSQKNTHVIPEVKKHGAYTSEYGRMPIVYVRSGGGRDICYRLSEAYLLWVKSYKIYWDKSFCKEREFDSFSWNQLMEIPGDHVISAWEVLDFTPLNKYLEESKSMEIQELILEEREKGLFMKIGDEMIFENFNDFNSYSGFQKILDEPNCNHNLFISDEGPTVTTWTDFEGENIRFKAIEFGSENRYYLKPFLVTRKNLSKLQERYNRGEFN